MGEGGHATTVKRQRREDQGKNRNNPDPFRRRLVRAPSDPSEYRADDSAPHEFLGHHPVVGTSPWVERVHGSRHDCRSDDGGEQVQKKIKGRALRPRTKREYAVSYTHLTLPTKR